MASGSNDHGSGDPSSIGIFILGPGKVGLSLSLLFERAGVKVIGMWGRRETSLRQSERLAGCPLFHGPMPGRVADAGIVLITTVDGAIEEVSRKLAGSRLLSEGAIVYHCSGAFDSSILRAVAGVGALTGTIHPLQAVPSVEVGLEVLPSSCFLVEGGVKAVEFARALVMKIGGRPIEISGGNRALYHASASMASNYLVTLVWQAAKMMADTGMLEGEAVEALMPMVKNVVGRMEELGVSGALTGPITRGDDRTLRVQLEAVAKKCPGDLPLFITLASSTMELVREMGRVDEERIERMRELLERFR